MSYIFFNLGFMRQILVRLTANVSVGLYTKREVVRDCLRHVLSEMNVKERS